IDVERFGQRAQLVGRPHEDGRDQSFRTRFDCARERRLVTWMRHCCWYGLQAPASLQQLFVLSGSSCAIHVASCTGIARGVRLAAGPVSLRKIVRTMAMATP